METEMRNFIISCVEQRKSDDLYRAKCAFRNCTKDEMNEEYGESGQTRQQVIDGYVERDDKCNTAIKVLRSIS